MTIWQPDSDQPQPRPDDRVHRQASQVWKYANPYRAVCGAGWNWPTDIRFGTEPAELTCTGCTEALREMAR